MSTVLAAIVRCKNIHNKIKYLSLRVRGCGQGGKRPPFLGNTKNVETILGPPHTLLKTTDGPVIMNKKYC